MKKKLLFTLTAMLAVFGLAFAATPEFNASTWWGSGDKSNGKIIQQTVSNITKENITVVTFQANKATVDAFKNLDADDIFALITYFNTLDPKPYTAPTALQEAVAALESANNTAANEKVQSIIEGIEALTDPEALTPANVKSLEDGLNDWLTVKADLTDTNLKEKEETLTTAIATAKTLIAQNESKAVIADILRTLLSNTSDNSANLKNLFPTAYANLGTDYEGSMTLDAFKKCTNKYQIVKLYIKEYDLIKDLNNGDDLATALSTFADGLAEEYYNAALVLQKAEQYIIGTDAVESFVKKYADGTVNKTAISTASEAQAKIYTYELNKILTQIGTPEAEYEDIAEMVSVVLTTAGVTNDLYNSARTKYTNHQVNTWISKLKTQFLSNHATILTEAQALQTLEYTLENTDDLYAEITGAIDEIEKYYYNDGENKSSLTDSVRLVYDPCGDDGDSYQVAFTHAEFNALYIGKTLKETSLEASLTALNGELKKATKYYYAKILRNDWIKAYKAEGKVLAATDYTIEDAAKFKTDIYNAIADFGYLKTKESSSLVFTPSLPAITAVEGVALEEWKWNTSSNTVDATGNDFGGDVMTQAYTFIKENDWTTPASEDCPSFTPTARNYAIFWINKYCSVDAESLLSKVRAANGAQLSSALITEIDAAIKFYTDNYLGTYSAFNTSAKQYYEELTKAKTNASADVATISGAITLYRGNSTAVVLEKEAATNPGQALCYTSKKALADTIAAVPNTIAYIAQEFIDAVSGDTLDLPLNVACWADNAGKTWRATKINLVDGSDFYIANDVIADTITLTKKFGRSNTTTATVQAPMYFPFDVTFGQLKEAFGENVIVRGLNAVYQEEGSDVVKINLQRKKNDSDICYAFKPYTIEANKSVDGMTLEITGDGSTANLKKTPLSKGKISEGSIASSTAGGAITATMQGISVSTTMKQSATTKIYNVNAKTGVWQKQQADGLSYPGGRIVLKIVTSNVNYAPRIVFDDDETTGIDNISSDMESLDGIYTINGVKVDNMNKPGLYIINGKKVVVK